MKLNKSNSIKIVRTEISSYRDTHKSGIVYRPHLFKLNKITCKDRLNNLCVLLTEHHSSYIELPTNKDVNLIIKANLDFVNEELNERN